MTASQLFRQRGFGSNGASVQPLGKPASAFPGRIAADADLAIAVNRQQTQLALPMGASDTSMTVVSPSMIVANCLLSIDSEIVQATAAPSGNVVPVTRGFDGTTPAIHLASATVSGFIDAWHHNSLVAEVEAIEQTLGANLANVPSASPPVANTAYQFAPQTPGGSLAAGTNSITLSPVPRGVNGTDTNHYLYVSGGTGAAEAVLITGGSAVAGAPSGTLFVTCANAHTGAWTIQSATAGIQEAMVAASPLAPWVKIPPGSYNIYGSIYPPTGATLEGAAAGWDSNLGPVVLNWIPLTGSLILISTDHVTVRGLFLYGGTSGAPTSSIGIDVSGYAPRGAITPQLYDIYADRFFVGVQAQDLTNSRSQAIAAFNCVSHGIVLASVQGPWIDLFAQRNGGDGIHVTTGGGGNTASPFLTQVHTHDNAGWGVNSVLQLNLSKFYVNFDKAGEIFINTGTGGLPGTIQDGHVEEAGNSPTYGVNNTAPGVRVASTSTSGVCMNGLQVNTNQGNGVEFLGGASMISDSMLAGNGIGGQAGFTFCVLASSPGQMINNNIVSGTMSISGGTQQITANNISASSANPLIDITGGTFDTVELNFLNQGGSGAAIRTAAGTSFYGPFTNNIWAGSVSMAGAVTSRSQYVAQNFIGSETGANNAIAGSLPGIAISTGLRVLVVLAHTLQAGPNTFSLNGEGGVPIKRHTNSSADLGIAYNIGGVIDLLRQGGAWLDMAQ